MSREAVSTASEAWDELDRELAADLGPGQPPATHPSLDELVAFQVGELEPGERERLLDHLAACSSCSLAVRETARHRAPEREGEPEALPEAEIDAAWRVTRERTVARPTAGVERFPPPRPATRPPRWLPLAATFLVAMGLGFLLGDRQASSPLVNPALVELLPASDGGTRGGEAPAVDPPQADGLHVLLAGRQTGGAGGSWTYRAVVRDARGRTVARVDGLRPDAAGRLSFVLRERPAPGSYVVELHPSAAGADAAALDTFPLELPKP